MSAIHPFPPGFFLTPGIPLPGAAPAEHLAETELLDLTLAGFKVVTRLGTRDRFVLDSRGDGGVRAFDADSHAVGEPETEPPGTAAAPPTVDLADRFGWIAALLSPGDDADQVALAAERLPEHIDLDRELPDLSGDQYLAVYWLLHTTLLHLDADRERVLAAAGDDRSVAAWAATDLGFGPRRALLVAYHRREDLGPAASALSSLEIDASLHPAMRATLVAEGDLDPSVIEDALTRISPGLGAAVLRAHLDLRSGAATSAAAAAIAADPGAFEGDWRGLSRVLSWGHPLIDPEVLTGALRWLLTHDSHQMYVLRTIRAAQKHAGRELVMSGDELERAEAMSHASTEALDDLAAGCPPPTEPGLRDLTARRVLMRFGWDPELAPHVAWAAREVLASGAPDRHVLAARGIDALESDEHVALTKALAAEATDPHHPAVTALLRVIASPPTESGWPVGKHQSVIEAAVTGLRPLAHLEPVYAAVMAIVDGHGPAVSVTAIWWKLFHHPTADATLHALSDEQVRQVARSLIASQLDHPDHEARQAAGNLLGSFGHPAARDVLVEALTEHGDRYSDEFGGLDPGGLYSAVANVGATEALVDRMLTEPGLTRTLHVTVGKLLTPELHAHAMGVIRRGAGHRAAAVYAHMLDSQRVGARELVELLRFVVDRPAPTDELEAGHFAYTLAVGMKAAFAHREYELVRRAHARFTIAGAHPVHPDEKERRVWKNPLDEAYRHLLADTLSGAADDRRADLLAKGERLRAANKPWKNITDGELGDIAGRAVACRLLTDKKSGVVWFADTDGGGHVFDGFGMASPPFVLTPLFPGHTHFADTKTVSQRATFLTAKGARCVDLIRCGERVLFLKGEPDGWWSSTGRQLMTFPDEETAIASVNAIRAAMFTQRYLGSSPWYAEGHGTITRSYRQRSSFDTRIGFRPWPDRDTDHYTDAAEQAARIDRETVELLRAGALPDHVSFNEHGRLPRDRSVVDWMRCLALAPDRDAVARVPACRRFAAYASAHGFPITVSATIGTGVAEEEIAAYERARGVTVPSDLRDFWLRVGSASWTVGGRSTRVLSPSDMLAHGQVVLPARDIPVDVLVARRDDEPITAFAPDRADEHGHRFARFDTAPGGFHWSSLTSSIARDFIVYMTYAIEWDFPPVEVLYHGMRADPALSWRRFERAMPTTADRLWEIYADEGNGLLATRYGLMGVEWTYSTKRMPPAQIAKKAAAAVRAKEAAGYVEGQQP